MPDNYTLTHEWLAGDLPVLTAAHADTPTDAPLVLVLHPLGSRKEKMLPGLYALARSRLPSGLAGHAPARRAARR